MHKATHIIMERLLKIDELLADMRRQRYENFVRAFQCTTIVSTLVFKMFLIREKIEIKFY